MLYAPIIDLHDKRLTADYFNSALEGALYAHVALRLGETITDASFGNNFREEAAYVFSSAMRGAPGKYILTALSGYDRANAEKQGDAFLLEVDEYIRYLMDMCIHSQDIANEATRSMYQVSVNTSILDAERVLKKLSKCEIIGTAAFEELPYNKVYNRGDFLDR